MVTCSRHFRGSRNPIWGAVALLILFGFSLQNVAGSTYYSLDFRSNTNISSPELILQNVTNSIIYTNKTSAKVTVKNGTNSLDVLQVTNQTSGQWKLQLIKYNEVNITHLTNCTIWFHNGNGNASVQIKILNGSYNQTSGDLYDFVSGSNITITASTNATDTSYIYTYLKILKPGTSTYALYVITFEIKD